MEIIQASLEHASLIAEKLVQHFEKANNVFGYNKYKTDVSKILKHVSERLENPESEFKYFLLIADDGQVAGFVNLMNTPTLYEILVLEVFEAFSSYENIFQLTEFAVNTLKELGATSILAETISVERNYSKALSSLGAQIIEQKHIIN